jgi:hypothetical protein
MWSDAFASELTCPSAYAPNSLSSKGVIREKDIKRIMKAKRSFHIVDLFITIRGSDG